MVHAVGIQLSDRITTTKKSHLSDWDELPEWRKCRSSQACILLAYEKQTKSHYILNRPLFTSKVSFKEKQGRVNGGSGFLTVLELLVPIVLGFLRYSSIPICFFFFHFSSLSLFFHLPPPSTSTNCNWFLLSTIKNYPAFDDCFTWLPKEVTPLLPSKARAMIFKEASEDNFGPRRSCMNWSTVNRTWWVSKLN